MKCFMFQIFLCALTLALCLLINLASFGTSKVVISRSMISCVFGQDGTHEKFVKDVSNV